MKSLKPPIAYSINSFCNAIGVGRTSIYDAIKVGELHTITPRIDGKLLKRRLITHQEGKRWLATFPTTVELVDPRDHQSTTIHGQEVDGEL